MRFSTVISMIYFYAIVAEEVWLLAVCAKNEKDDLTNDEKKKINRFVEALKAN